MTSPSFLAPPRKELEPIQPPLQSGSDDDHEDRFYESFDRILSSSCSSTSASDDDLSTFLTNADPYRVWLSAPDSVEDRRRNLLSKLDLDSPKSHPSALASSKSDGSSVFPPKSNGSGLVSSTSEGSNVFSAKSDGSSLFPPKSSGSGLVSEGSNVFSAKFETSTVVSAKSGCFGGDSVKSGVVSAKSVGFDGDSGRSVCLEGGSEGDLTRSGGSEVIFSSGTSDTVYEDDEEYSCTFRNLDNGEEYLVREEGEDGSYDKLKVVDTGGRQLTFEEFHSCVVGQSPIVQELLRRQSEEAGGADGKEKFGDVKVKKKGGWLRSIKHAAGAVVHVRRKERRSSDEKDTSSENGGRRRSSSATDDSQDVHSHHGGERVKVRHYGKTFKELTGLYMNQEIQGHAGSIWTIKFSLDGQYLASAGEDCVIHIWQVELGRKGDLMGSVEDASSHSMASTTAPSDLDRNDSEKKRKGKVHHGRKSLSFDHLVIPETVFTLSEKPVFSLRGHEKDVLDLSWSKSKHLLSSSMDKTVRLWDLTSSSCLKIFSHNDYVTSIQFNPSNDKYFISGSLDAKVRIWSIEYRQVVDWDELHEMITAACYTPDGQGAYVGTHKGHCHFFCTSENKLQKKVQINIQNKKKKSHLKKITGFEFVPGSSSEVFITSADSRIRIVDDRELIHKFKGFRNKASQISASLTADGKHVICASEDSQVYVWRYEADSRTSRSVGSIGVTQNHEYFHCRDVSAAVAWPGNDAYGMSRSSSNGMNIEDLPSQTHLPTYDCNDSAHLSVISTAISNPFLDRGSATWPEEKLAVTQHRRRSNGGISEFNGQLHSTSAWGMVIVTAGRGGEIKTFQNFGYPIRV